MSRFSEGWVKLHRGDLKDIGDRYEVRGLWASLLGMASRYEIEVKMDGQLVSFPAGSVVTSLPELSQHKGKKALSKIRRDLNFLESIGKIKQHTAKEGRVILIDQWETEEVENSKKEAENRQNNDTITADKRRDNDRSTDVLNSENDLEKANGNLYSTDKQQDNDRKSYLKRQPNGEGEENKKKEESHLSSPNTPINLQTQERREPFPWERIGEELPNQAPEEKEASTPQDCAVPPAFIGPIELLKIWNENRGTLPEAKALTASRRKSATSRLRECSNLDYWVSIVKTVAASPFCNGENDRQWRAGFDFLLRPDTHVKVTEGQYANSPAPKLRPKTVEEIYQ